MDLYAVMSYLGVPAVVGLHRRAVERAAVRDLPELFRAFGADTEVAGDAAGRMPRRRGRAA
ncbi:hypothetical protein ACFU98_46545 [Streptomyces sp. NPDC057575]|uniref:hypothetical protein n=1 Tax=unclassified Streptomyces TaxID=2593676 RepID=UPI0036A52DC2